MKTQMCMYHCHKNVCKQGADDYLAIKLLNILSLHAHYCAGVDMNPNLEATLANQKPV